MMGARLLGQVSGKVADLVIGLILGPVALGFFHVASRALHLLYQFAITPLQTTSLSAFARLDGASSIGKGYVRLTRTTALVSFPAFFGAAAIAPDFVVVCFGSQWRPSGAVMTALALVVMPATLVTFSQPALIAVGRTRLVLASNLVVLVLNAIVALATVSFGIVAVAAGQVARAHLTLPFVLYMLRKGIGLSFGQPLRSIANPAIAAGLMAAVVVLARLALDDFPASIRLVLCVMIGAAVYVMLLLTIARRYTAETMFELLPHLPARARDLALRIVPRI
jgi:PST family polysaccharide transporter